MGLFRTRDFGKVISDPVFGELRLDECNAWRGRVVIWGGEAELHVNGKPDVPALGRYRDGFFRAATDYLRFVRGAYGTRAPDDVQHAAWRAVLGRKDALRRELAEAARQRLYELEGDSPAAHAADMLGGMTGLPAIEIAIPDEEGSAVVFRWACNWDVEHGFEVRVVEGKIMAT